ARAGGRGALRTAAPLAGAVWAYDLWLKSTPAGPAAMGLCRGLNVLLGAERGGVVPALPAALTIGAHTVAVTTLSRHEVTGAPVAVPLATLAATGAVATAAARPLPPRLPATPGSSSAGSTSVGDGAPPGRGAVAGVVAAGLAGLYVRLAGGAQLAAARAPTAGAVRRAVGSGILALLPLQAALLARHGALPAALAVAAAHPLAKRLSARVSAT
ncbi:4-hydroxybenzoate polyprenyltransferase, partial [Nonomuraea angiospora]|uniref:4-hydroxybenzoate polyprenyltransferase n=1 Tax=Nonomuraea angiospora TaxID=46172 RepID=UPI003418F9F8